MGRCATVDAGLIYDEVKGWLQRAHLLPLDRARRSPSRNRNIHIGGWEIDCYSPEHKLAVEPNGGRASTTI